MTTLDSNARFNLFFKRDFFDALTCAELVAELRASRREAATIYGRGAAGAVEERVRKSEMLSPSHATIEFVKRRLMEHKAELEAHFGMSLGVCEEPQFLRYAVGDFFVAHQDGNTPLLRFDRERNRRVSVVIFLSDQTETPRPESYCGGSLVFSDMGGGRHETRGAEGALIAFRAETTHEVTPVISGERYSIISWHT